MDEAFKGLVNKCIIIYMDDLTVFSKNQVDHLSHLKQILGRCCKYEISLNPKKCFFGVTKGKLLGHIIFKVGISIDLDQVEAILKLSPMTNRKELTSFFGKINFICKFISGFSKIAHPLNDLLRKEKILNGYLK